MSINGPIRLRVLPALLPINGRQTEMRATDTYIQYRYVGDPDWINIIALSELVGPTGPNVELQSNGTYLQWRAEGDVAWNDLILIADITGPQGASPTLAMGAVSTLTPGSPATAAFTPIAGGYELTLGLPAGATGPAGAVPPLAQGRLSLVSGVSVPESDAAGQIIVYYVPTMGVYVPIYDGTSFVSSSIGSQLSLALDNNTGHTNYHQTDKNFDLFAINDAGTIKLGTGPKWDNGAVAGSDVARGTGAASTELELFGGFWVNKNSITIRTGSASGDTVVVAARRATYLGSLRGSANGQATDSKAKRWLYNAYNQTIRTLFKTDANPTWAYSDGTNFQQARADATNQVDVLLGLSGAMVDVFVQGVCSSTVTAAVQTAVGLDGTTGAAIPAESLTGYNAPTSTQPVSVPASWKGYPGLGRHRLVWLERGGGSGTQTWFGTLTKIQAGITGSVVM